MWLQWVLFSSDRSSYSDDVLEHVHPLFQFLSISANIHRFFLKIEFRLMLPLLSLLPLLLLLLLLLLLPLLPIVAIAAIFGFLLSERMSGVSPVIFIYGMF